MNDLSTNFYKFGDFLFDADKLALYHQNQLIRNVGEKSLQVLAVLLQNANELASHEEIIEQVWQDNYSGITPVNIAQNIKNLRKFLKQYEPDEKFIENIKGRGYMFVGKVEAGEIDLPKELSFLQSDPLFIHDQTDNALQKENYVRRSLIKPAFIFAALIAASVLSIVAWNSLVTDDEKEIMRMVEDSQKFESLVLYKNPENFEESQLRKYWMPETEFNSEFDIKKIREAVQRLNKEGRYYGKETKPEQFEFQYVEINTSRDFAVVKTLEKWFIVEYLKDGTLLKTKTVGPYFVSYILRKVDGRWLIERSNTARANPAPQN